MTQNRSVNNSKKRKASDEVQENGSRVKKFHSFNYQKHQGKQKKRRQNSSAPSDNQNAPNNSTLPLPSSTYFPVNQPVHKASDEVQRNSFQVNKFLSFSYQKHEEKQEKRRQKSQARVNNQNAQDNATLPLFGRTDFPINQPAHTDSLNNNVYTLSPGLYQQHDDYYQAMPLQQASVTQPASSIQTHVVNSEPEKYLFLAGYWNFRIEKERRDAIIILKGLVPVNIPEIVNFKRKSSQDRTKLIDKGIATFIQYLTWLRRVQPKLFALFIYFYTSIHTRNGKNHLAEAMIHAGYEHYSDTAYRADLKLFAGATLSFLAEEKTKEQIERVFPECTIEHWGRPEPIASFTVAAPVQTQHVATNTNVNDVENSQPNPVTVAVIPIDPNKLISVSTSEFSLFADNNQALPAISQEVPQVTSTSFEEFNYQLSSDYCDFDATTHYAEIFQSLSATTADAGIFATNNNTTALSQQTENPNEVRIIPEVAQSDSQTFFDFDDTSQTVNQNNDEGIYRGLEFY